MNRFDSQGRRPGRPSHGGGRPPFRPGMSASVDIHTK